MESFVTRRELDKVLNDLNKLRLFLSDTFGAKFQDFMKEDEDEENLEKDSESSPNPDQSRTQTITVEIVRSEKLPPAAVPDPLQVSVRIPPPPLPTPTVPTVIDLTETDDIPSSSTSEIETDMIMMTSTSNDSHIEKRDAAISHFHKVRKNRKPSVRLRMHSSQWRSPNEAKGVVPIKVNSNVVPPKPQLPSFQKKRSLNLDDGNPKQQKTGPTTTTATAVASTSTSNSSSGENEIIQCDDCQLFIFASQIESHKRNHALYDARKVEKTSSLLRQQYKCPVCQENCEDFDDYEEHLNEAHTDLKGKPCPICSKALHARSLRRHLLLHDQLKFSCDICGKAYNRSDNLSAHYKTHENNMRVEYFYCSYCNNAFASREGRDRHLATSHQGSSAIRNSGTSLEANTAPTQETENDLADTATTNGPIFLVAAETERIKIDCDNLFDFEDEGDDY